MVAVELLVAGVIAMLVAVLARLAWVIGRRQEREGPSPRRRRARTPRLCRRRSRSRTVASARGKPGAAEAPEQAIGIGADRQACGQYVRLDRPRRPYCC